MKLKGLYQKHGVWWFQPKQVKGVRPKAFSLGTKDELEAIERWQELSDEQFHTHRSGRLKLEIERYLKEKKDGQFHTDDTHTHSAAVLRGLDKFFRQGMDVNEITTGYLRRWQNHLIENGNTPATIRTYIGRVSGFFTWAVDEKLIKTNPCKELKLPRTFKTKSEKYCTKTERDQLVTTIERMDIALVFWLGFFAGLRIKEIIEARRNWLDMDAGVITVQNTETFTTKDKAHRAIRMSARLREFLNDYLDYWAELPHSKKSDFLLRPDKKHGRKIRSRGKKAWKYRYDPRRPFKDHARSCGLDWVGFHTMRHTFATLHAMANTPLTTIAREMGDDPKTTFKNYVGYSRHDTHADSTD